MIGYIDPVATVNGLQKLRSEFAGYVDHAIYTAVKVAQITSKGSKKFKDHSPNGLRANINIIKNGESDYTYIADKPYAGYVEYGNRPGGTGMYIYPVRAKALRFVINGQVIFAKRVRSHGPLTFFKDGVDVAETDLMPLLEDGFVKLLG